MKQGHGSNFSDSGGSNESFKDKNDENHIKINEVVKGLIESINYSKNYLKMKEAIKNYYPLYKIFSINNNINPTVDILIESIDRFSFGEYSDDENISKNEKEEQKMRKNGPNNFGYIKAGNNLIESNSKLKDLNDIINGIEVKVKKIKEY